MAAHEFCVVTTTAKSDATVQALIDGVLAAKLAACVQVFPIQSHYVWKGERCQETEQLLMMKAKSADFADLAALIKRLHDYETPEILRMDVADGDPAYLGWIRQITR